MKWFFLDLCSKSLKSRNCIYTSYSHSSSLPRNLYMTGLQSYARIHNVHLHYTNNINAHTILLYSFQLHVTNWDFMLVFIKSLYKASIIEHELLYMLPSNNMCAVHTQFLRGVVKNISLSEHSGKISFYVILSINFFFKFFIDSCTYKSAVLNAQLLYVYLHNCMFVLIMSLYLMSHFQNCRYVYHPFECKISHYRFQQSAFCNECFYGTRKLLYILDRFRETFFNLYTFRGHWCEILGFL